MTRPLEFAVALVGALGLVACGATSDSGSAGGTAAAASDESTSDGYVFKGPMEDGSGVLLIPLGPDLEELDGQASFDVSGGDGGYSATIAHAGLVRIEAEGYVFNEAKGETDASGMVKLVAYGEVGERTSLHVNLLTDLIHLAVEQELRAGVPFTEAEALVLDQFFDALPFDDRPEPDISGRDLHPHDSGYEQAWLLGFSSIVAEAARHGESTSDDFQVQLLLEALREDFADDRQFRPENIDLFLNSEAALNPDLATLGLTAHHTLYGNDHHPVADLHMFLDSDHDGIRNFEDNCRYLPNADQRESTEGPFGVDCDTRLLDIATSEEWGCGLTAHDSYIGPAGSVTCWEVAGATTGGAPPTPTAFPGAPHNPWEGDSPFAGAPGDPPPSFVDIELAARAMQEPWVCATNNVDMTVCWDGEEPGAPFILDEGLVDLTMSPGQVCGTSLVTGSTTCFDRDGQPTFSLTPALDAITHMGLDQLCGIDAILGNPLCIDAGGLPISGLDGQPPAIDIDANTADAAAYLCIVAESDGAITCLDLDETDTLGPPPAPEGAGYVEVAVGLGTVCGTKADGSMLCTRFPESSPEGEPGEPQSCPEHAKPPEFATHVQIDRCHACGIGSDGFGACWPDNWSRGLAEGDHGPQDPGGGGGGGSSM